MAVWSLIPFNETLETERLDAEHYQPKYLAAELAVSKVPHLPLKQLAASIKRGVQPVYDELGTVPVLRSVNVQNGGLSGNRQLHVSQEMFDKAVRGQTGQHDVLLTSTGVGTLGRAAALDTAQPYFADGHITIIRGLSRITPFYLSVFLMSETGQLLIYRRHRGSSGQIEIYPDDIASIPVPIPPAELLQELEQIQQTRVEAVERSNALYNEAEALLLHELGLDRLQLPTAKTYTAPFVEVMAAERMDAEFYQPKYYALLSLLQKTGAAVRLGDYLRSPVKRGMQPDYVEGGEMPVIKSQHIGPRFITLDDPDSRTSYEIGNTSKTRRAVVGYGDVLLNSTGVNTIGRSQPLLQNVAAFADGHVAILRPTPGLDPVYLSAFLNSQAGYLQTERAWTGSSGQIELRPDLVDEYTIWLAPQELQRTIRDMIESSQQLRESATGLLAAAQQRVEAFIKAD